MGAELPTPQVRGTLPVETGHVMMFARAVGAVSETIVPPTFVQAFAHFDPAYPFRPHPGAPWYGSGRSAGDAAAAPGAGRSLHAEQEYEFLRPLRVGDTLRVVSVPGRTWEKEGRSGRLQFTETITEYRDDASGELVVRARAVSVVTEGRRAP